MQPFDPTESARTVLPEFTSNSLIRNGRCKIHAQNQRFAWVTTAHFRTRKLKRGHKGMAARFRTGGLKKRGRPPPPSGPSFGRLHFSASRTCRPGGDRTYPPNNEPPASPV